MRLYSIYAGLNSNCDGCFVEEYLMGGEGRAMSIINVKPGK